MRHLFDRGERVRLRRENSLLRKHLRVALDDLRLAWDELEHQRYAACHDALTGLPNRRMLSEVGLGAAAIMLDLDWFKEINDHIGHGAGDRVLVVLGNRFARRLGECWLPVRLGGDEFAAVRITSADEPSLAAEAATLAGALTRPMWIDGQPLRVSCSIGLAIASEPVDVSALLDRADAALATAKQRASRPAAYTNGDTASINTEAPPAIRARNHRHAHPDVSMLVVVTDDGRTTPTRVVARAAAPGDAPTWQPPTSRPAARLRQTRFARTLVTTTGRRGFVHDDWT